MYRFHCDGIHRDFLNVLYTHTSRRRPSLRWRTTVVSMVDENSQRVADKNARRRVSKVTCARVLFLNGTVFVIRYQKKTCTQGRIAGGKRNTREHRNRVDEQHKKFMTIKHMRSGGVEMNFVGRTLGIGRNVCLETEKTVGNRIWYSSDSGLIMKGGVRNLPPSILWSGGNYHFVMNCRYFSILQNIMIIPPIRKFADYKIIKLFG